MHWTRCVFICANTYTHMKKLCLTLSMILCWKIIFDIIKKTNKRHTKHNEIPKTMTNKTETQIHLPKRQPEYLWMLSESSKKKVYSFPLLLRNTIKNWQPVKLDYKFSIYVSFFTLSHFAHFDQWIDIRFYIYFRFRVLVSL